MPEMIEATEAEQDRWGRAAGTWLTTAPRVDGTA